MKKESRHHATHEGNERDECLDVLVPTDTGIKTLINGAENDTLATKKEIFVAAYLKSLCNVSEACREVGISRQTFYRWKEEDSDFGMRIDEAIEQKIDWYEQKAHELVQRGDTTMTIFLLKTQGRKRGYADKPPEDEQVSDIQFILDDIQKMTIRELNEKITESLDG